MTEVDMLKHKLRSNSRQFRNTVWLTLGAAVSLPLAVFAVAAMIDNRPIVTIFSVIWGLYVGTVLRDLHERMCTLNECAQTLLHQIEIRTPIQNSEKTT